MSDESPFPSGRRRDPLLGTVRVVLSFGMVIAIVVTTAVLMSVPATLIWRDAALAVLTSHSDAVLPPEMIYAVTGVQLLVAVTALIGFHFVRHLRRIIDTVAQGDPFIPENALRLRHMAWLAMGIEFLSIPAGALAGWIAWASHSRFIDVGFSFGGALLALILFVLARVFRKGADMRDELEGTV